MNNLVSGLLLIGLFASCATSNHSNTAENLTKKDTGMEGAVANMKKPLPFLPPGKEYGETWDEARKYDYAMDIYVTPEYIAYPLKGTGFLLSQLHSKYSDPVCKGGDSKVILRFVISPNGQLIGTHPIGRVSLDCLVHLTKSVMDVKYFPAEYNGENVYMLHAVTINDRR